MNVSWTFVLRSESFYASVSRCYIAGRGFEGQAGAIRLKRANAFLRSLFATLALSVQKAGTVGDVLLESGSKMQSECWLYRALCKYKSRLPRVDVNGAVNLFDPLEETSQIVGWLNNLNRLLQCFLRSLQEEMGCMSLCCSLSSLIPKVSTSMQTKVTNVTYISPAAFDAHTHCSTFFSRPLLYQSMTIF